MTELRWERAASEWRLRGEVRSGQILMAIGGKYVSPESQQLWIDHPGWQHGRAHLARLCMCHLHPGWLHWHYFEGDVKKTVRDADLPDDADLADRSTLFLRTFVPRLKIVNCYLGEGLV